MSSEAPVWKSRVTKVKLIPKNVGKGSNSFLSSHQIKSHTFLPNSILLTLGCHKALMVIVMVAGTNTLCSALVCSLLICPGSHFDFQVCWVTELLLHSSANQCDLTINLANRKKQVGAVAKVRRHVSILLGPDWLIPMLKERNSANCKQSVVCYRAVASRDWLQSKLFR